MCDTAARIISDTYAIFGKNSDRAVNEPQALEYYGSADYPEGTMLQCTYITIPQARHTNAVVLSRPAWMWGGEIGVNEYGVCIGNEAVFTRGVYGKESLIGMDYVRLALERGNSAKEATDTIVSLIQRYGQGGNCGYDHSFRYNNSYLIMDRKEIYILETVGKDYACKKVQHGTISNMLSIQEDGDFYALQKCNFARRYTDPLTTFVAQAKTRHECTSSHQLNDLFDMMAVLSSHNGYAVEMAAGSCGSVCMHASNDIRCDQTTMSMIVELKSEQILIWTTGCSLPCLSLYKPTPFGASPIISDGKSDFAYWYRQEKFHRSLLCKDIPQQYYEERDDMQDKIETFLNREDMTQLALDYEQQWQSVWKSVRFENRTPHHPARYFWKRKNRIFEAEYKAVKERLAEKR